MQDIIIILIGCFLSSSICFIGWKIESKSLNNKNKQNAQ